MHITTETSSDALLELQSQHIARWADEHGQILKARRDLMAGSPELDRAEVRFADFETATTAVLTLNDQMAKGTLEDNILKAQDSYLDMLGDLIGNAGGLA